MLSPEFPENNNSLPPQGPGPKTNRLTALNNAIQYKIDSDKALKSIKGLSSMPTAGGGYVPQDTKWIAEQSRIAGLSFSDAVGKEKQEFDAARPFMDEFYTANLNGEAISKYKTKDLNGFEQPNEGEIAKSVHEWVTDNGGGANIENLMAAEMKARITGSLTYNKGKQYAEQNLESLKRSGKLKGIDDEGHVKKISELQSIVANGAKIVNSEFESSVKSAYAKKKAEFAPLVKDVTDKYLVKLDEVKQNVTNDAIVDSQFKLDQLADQLEEQVAQSANPDIMVKSAQLQLDKAVEDMRKANELYFRSQEFTNNVNQKFEQNYGDDYKQEIAGLNHAYVAQTTEIYNKQKDKAKRKLDEINRIGDHYAKQLDEVYNKLDAPSLNLVNKAYADGFMKAAIERDNEQSKAVQNLYDFTNPMNGAHPQAQMVLAGKLFGDKFANNLGVAMKSLGYAINSAGIEGAVSDWLKQEGGSLFSKNFLYSPDLKASNFMSLGFMGESVAQLAFSAPPLIAGAGLSMIPGGQAISVPVFAAVSTIYNAGINAGDTYQQYIEKHPGDFVGASDAAQKMFAMNFATLPMEATIGKFWFGGKKGVSALLKASASEFVTESYESGVQQALLDPKTGNLASDTFNAWKSKQAMTEGVMAGFGTLLTGGMSSLGGRMKSAITGLSNPGVQFLAGHVYDRSASYAKAMFAGSESEYKPQTLNGIMGMIDRMEVAIKDAKELGMDKPTAMLYAQKSEDAHAERAKLDKLTNPAARERQEKKVKAIEDDMGKLIDGNERVALISIAGQPTVALEEKEAEKLLSTPAMQEAIAQGHVTVDTDNKDIQEMVEERSKGFKIDDKDTFYHASDTKRNGRLKPSTAKQFGTGIYFSTNQDLVKDEFGNEVTEVRLSIEKPVYTNTKEWHDVEALAIKKFNDRLQKDEDGDIIGEANDLNDVKPNDISDAAKELGYDAIVDKGSKTYENEIVVLDESKIKYPEDSPITTAVIDNVDSINEKTPAGKQVTKLLSEGASQDDIAAVVAEAVVKDEDAAEQAFGIEVVAETKSAILAKLEAMKVKEGFTKAVYHGTYADELDDKRDDLIWFTDNKKVADQYRKRSVFTQNANLEGYDDSEEIYESESGISTVADEQGIDLSKGSVIAGKIKNGQMLDMSDYSGNLSGSSIKEVWDDLFSKGLVDDSWENFDEDTQQEIFDDYKGKAIWVLLEGEGIYNKAKSSGFDGVIINDVGIDGKIHESYGMFGISKFEKNTENKSSKKDDSNTSTTDIIPDAPIEAQPEAVQEQVIAEIAKPAEPVADPMDAKIKSVGKPTFTVAAMPSTKDLVNSKNPVENKKSMVALKKEVSQINALIECLWK